MRAAQKNTPPLSEADRYRAFAINDKHLKWNWQRPDWPNFSWDAVRLRKVDEHLLLQSGVVAGVFKHLGAQDRDQLTVDAISAEALTSSENRR